MKSIKKAIKDLPVIGGLAKLVYRLIKPENIYFSSYWIDKYIPNEPITIVQIGSNDGIRGDPIYQLVKKNKLWNVLFVEPVPYIFERLENNYGDEPRFKYENSAINEDGTNQFFYSIDKEAFDKIPNLSEDYNQIGSFYKEQVQKLSEGLVDEFIVETEVNCITLSELFNKNGIVSLEAFLVDAEGYDWKILSQLRLNQFKPNLIVFEYLNLEESERKEAINYLKKDYYIFSFRIDFLCIRKDKIKPKDLSALKEKRINEKQ